MLFRWIYLFIMFGVSPNRFLLDPPPKIRQDSERMEVVRGEEAQSAQILLSLFAADVVILHQFSLPLSRLLFHCFSSDLLP